MRRLQLLQSRSKLVNTVQRTIFHEVREADVARLSPLNRDHINMLGRYLFAVPETLARGDLRPLRNAGC